MTIKKFFIIILLISCLIVSGSFIIKSIYFKSYSQTTEINKSALTKKNASEILSSSINREVQKNSNRTIVITVHINPNQTASYVASTEAAYELSPPLQQKPKVGPGNYIFSVAEIDSEGKVLYFSWNAFPIIKNGINGFDIKVAVPFYSNASVKLNDENNKQLLITTLK